MDKFRKIEFLFNLGLLTNILLSVLRQLEVIGSTRIQSIIAIIMIIVAVFYVISYLRNKPYDKENAQVTLKEIPKHDKIISIVALFMFFILVMISIIGVNSMDKNLVIGIAVTTYILMIYANIVRYKAYDI